ncbi:hypothetical protein VH569_05665 [Azospirillum sp. 11R-A]|uniref:hypothetical protein n=1 Tax=Azospirillum sp. 11R-A TaxID=3111634 RepID=UPI003C1BC457
MFGFFKSYQIEEARKPRILGAVGMKMGEILFNSVKIHGRPGAMDMNKMFSSAVSKCINGAYSELDAEDRYQLLKWSEKPSRSDIQKVYDLAEFWTQKHINELMR